MVEEKNLLGELRIKYKNFKERREDNDILFKKELFLMRKDLLERVDSLAPADSFYEPSDRSTEMHREIQRDCEAARAIEDDVKHLNELESFFDMKPTYVNKLDSLISKLEHLEEIWVMWRDYRQDLDELRERNVMQVPASTLVRKYEGYARKADRSHKDPDYFKLTAELTVLLPQLLSTLYFLQELQSDILRGQDYDEISLLVESALG